MGNYQFNCYARSLHQTSAAIAVVVLLLVSTPSYSWGTKGHRIVNGKAVDALRSVASPLYNFYNKYREYLATHSSDPDMWRHFDKHEGPRHYLNVDAYGSEPPFPALPHDRKKAEALFGKAFVTKGGLVPWAIGYRYRQLVLAFTRRDADNVLKQSAALGHYVGDAHVPVHATVNYDGQLTKQKGIHARFESEIVDQSINEAALHVARARPISNPAEAAFQWVIDSWVLVSPVLDADRKAAERDPLYGAEYYRTFTPQALPIAQQRLRDAATDLGSLWFSAWQEAGRPQLPRAALSSVK